MGSGYQKNARANGGQSNSWDDQVIESRGPESVARRDVSDMDELPQILWYVASQSTVHQDSNLVGNALRHT